MANHYPPVAADSRDLTERHIEPQWLREARIQIEAEVEQYRVARGPAGDDLWLAVFDYAMNVGNTPKTAALFADTHAQTFADGGPPKVDPKLAEQRRERLIAERAYALQDNAEHAYASATHGQFGTPQGAGPIAGVGNER